MQKLKDFWDMWDLMGSDAVKEALGLGAKGKESTPPAEAPKVSAGILEVQLISKILKSFAPNLVRQGKDYFKYQGTHWRHLDPLAAPDYFKKVIDQTAGGKLKFKDIQSAYSRFFIHVPHVPVGINMFSPNPLKQNFKNGTLVLEPNSDGTFKINFHKHKMEDYLIHCHDFDYQENAPLNEEFEACLDRIWANDPDKEIKKNAYFEVLGACLVSAFRKLVLFVGPPKTGKSTLVLFASNMVHQDYRCSVDPTQFHGFNLESMAGKLLNYDTDINLVRPLTDSILKKVEDRSPMRIARKGIADIYAPIPGMHLYGANRMPMSSEAGQAYDRRMLVFLCDKFQPKGQEYIQDYAQHVWRLNSQGIVTRAIEGMKRLAANGGHFTIPESSKAKLEQWQNDQGDIVQDFLQDLESNEVVDVNNQIVVVEEGRIERKHMWNIFKAWADNFASRDRVPGKIKFYARLEQLGKVPEQIKSVRYFTGICIVPSKDSMV